MALSQVSLNAISSADDPARAARVDLAAAHRLAARFGLDDGIWNHFSLEVPDRPAHFLVKPHGLLCREITASNLIAVDAEGATVEGRGAAERTAVCIHSPVHLARADAACVLHAHPRYATWLSMVEGGRLMPINQDGMRYYGRISYDDEYCGVALDAAEGERIAGALGDNTILILANHGVIVTGETVAAAFYDLYYLELCCQEQFTLLASGAAPRLIAPAVAERTRKQFEGAEAGGAALYFEALKRRLDAEEPDYRS